MATRERCRDRGARLARGTLAELGRELRDARLALGLRQVDVAHAAGVSRAWVGRVELGKAPEVGVHRLSVMLAVVGLDLRGRAYSSGTPYRDEAHARLLGRFRELLPRDSGWRTEVPFPMAGDQRARDAMAVLWGLRVAVEAETRPTDVQSLQRRLALKRRDGAADRLVLVLADTRANRAFLRGAGGALRTSFLLQGRATIAALRTGEDPGEDLVVLA